MMIPIVVVEVILDLKHVPAEDKLSLLRDAVERQKIINARRTVIALPDEYPDGDAHDPRD